ncbi:ALS2 C-terminal-like protein isoform X2 [Dipodomys merriami]
MEEKRKPGTMGISEETALLQLEELFSATLARIDSLILQPLLSAEPEHLEPRGGECLQLLQRLHQCTQRLWEVTDQSLRSLRHRLQHPSCSLETLLLLSEADRVLEVHVEYIESYTNCIVATAFQSVIKRKSKYWQGQRKALGQILTGGLSSKDSLGAMLAQALHQPLTQHVQQYVILLLRMKDSLEEGHPSQKTVMRAISLFGDLQSFMRQALLQAEVTQSLWYNLSSHLRDVLCTPTRRLLLDSQDVPVAVTPLRAERVLLFDDALVLFQGHRIHTFDLKLVWVDSGQDECECLIATPEDEFSLCARDPQDQVIWRWKMFLAVGQALQGKKDFPGLGSDLESAVPPAHRRAAYTFRQEGRLCGASYDGEWHRGRPQGKGTLKWPDGQNHVGHFHHGLEHGFGILLLPGAAEDKFDCYKCHWREGRKHGYGMCEYSTGETYKGYFQDDLRHGFGVLERAPPAPQAFRYTGHWERGQRNGFGVQDDIDGGERYIGWWQTDQHHGPGILVTQAGICYQGTFQMDKMAGPGVLLFEDDSLHEGTFTRDLMLRGKGKVTLPDGFVLEGWFARGTGKGLYTQGVLDTSAFSPDPSSTSKRQLGVGAVPANGHWQGVFDPFWAFVREGCPEDLQEAFLGFHIQRAKELQSSQDNLCCQRSHPEDSRGAMRDILEDVLRHREPEALQPFLRKALCNSQHPLGKLLSKLMLTFQATYTGVGANKHLQDLAQDQVKQHARGLWAAYRGLLQVALESKGQTLEEEDEKTRNLQVYGLILPLLLPSFYGELFTLYLLLHKKEDTCYSQRLTKLGLLSDTKLLEFLDVQKYLWPLSDIKLTSNERYSFVREKCFLSATELLQKVLTTVDPWEKLQVLEKTYREIEATVMRVMGQEHRLTMDELLPLLIYVLVRARILNLGAELHLIRDMMDPSHLGGLYDFLLTTLE